MAMTGTFAPLYCVACANCRAGRRGGGVDILHHHMQLPNFGLLSNTPGRLNNAQC